MDRYTRLLQSQARAIELLFLLITVAGAFAYRFLPSDVYPELSFPRISVIAEAGDMAPNRVVVSITRILEQAVSQVYNVRWIRSKTIRGAAEVNVDFQEGCNMQYALQQLQARVAEVRNDLPPNTNLTIERVTPAIFPVITYNVSSDTVTQSDLYYYGNYVIKPALTRVAGVARVIAQGGDVPQVSVQIDPAKMSALRVSLNQISDALQKSNQVQVLGKLNRDYQLNLVVSGENIKTVDQLNNIVISEATRDTTPSTPVPAGEPGSGVPENTTAPQAAPIYLHDVGTVSWGIADKTQIISANGKRGLAINIFRQPNSDVVSVSRGVKEAFDRLKKQLPPGISISAAYDESHLVIDAIKNVRDAILTGIFLIIVVLFLFLREWRSTLMAAISIPISSLAAFGILKLCGQSLNLMSLGGLAVAIGLVIDDAVVVIENIDRQLRKGLAPLMAVSQAMHELVAPVVSSTITTVVVFVPLGLLSGVAGQFFTSFTVTLTAAVVFSLFLSLSLTPTLAARWLKTKHTTALMPGFIEESGGGLEPRPTDLKEPALQSGVPSSFEEDSAPERGWDAKVLRTAFSLQWLLAAVAVGLMAATVFVAMQLGTDFLPAVDEGSYMFDYLAPAGSSLTETDSVAKVLEQILSKTPEVQAFTRRTGAESGLFATETNKGDIQVVLKPSNQRHRTIWEIMDAQRGESEQALAQRRCRFPPNFARRAERSILVESPISIKIFGQDLPVLRLVGGKIEESIKDIPELSNSILTGQAGAPANRSRDRSGRGWAFGANAGGYFEPS